MSVDPTEFQGVGDQPGTGVEGGVPQKPVTQGASTGQPPAKPAAEPAVPVEPATAPETAKRVNLDDLEDFRRWKAEADRRLYEQRMAAEQAAREAEQWRTKAETADMPEEDRYKYLYEKSQERISRLEQQEAERALVEQYRFYIADRLGVPPESLNPYDRGVMGMIEQAGAIIAKGTRRTSSPPAPSRVSQPVAPPVPVEPPKVPSAPTSTAPKTEFEEWKSLPYEERQKRLRTISMAGKFGEFMESLGDEE